MTTASYDVGGVISPRPFRLRRLGHIGYDVDHLDDTLDFFVRDLGLGVSDVLDLRLLPGLEQVVSNVADPRVVFLTPANDHHSIVLIPRQPVRRKIARHSKYSERSAAEVEE